jgi:2-C-methyl-D-erythritol 4-phosphate cytidylyltransferase
MKKIVVIVAGGSGNRMKSDLPKQFLLLGDKPVLMHTLYKFYNFDPEIELRLVLPQEETETWKKLCHEYNFNLKHTLFHGGKTRFHSVKNGLNGINNSSLVAIHDGVRPLVNQKTISNCFALASKNGSAIPVMPLTESIRKINKNSSKAGKREQFVTVQTPQVFKSEILLKSYNTDYIKSFTDDASVVEKAGYYVFLTEGNEENIKITTPKDLIIAEAIISGVK